MDEPSAQVIQAFKQMAPYLDGTLKLTPNPGATKRPKHADQKRDNKPSQHQELNALVPAVKLMARLVVNLDRDMQMHKREDTFILFFNRSESTGSLQKLLKAAEDWHSKATTGSSSSPMMPLRQHLLQILLQDLMDRIQRLVDAPEGSDLMQAAVKTLTILPDRTFPYLEWSAQKQAMQVAQRPAISLQKMHQNCTELLDMMRDVSIIQRFHALPMKDNSPIAPWRLQLALRADRPWELIQSLSQSSVWSLMAMSMKPHNRFQSPMAERLETMLELRPKGKGRGKGKSKDRKK